MEEAKERKMIANVEESKIWKAEKIAVNLYSSDNTSSKKVKIFLGKAAWKFDFQQGKYILNSKSNNTQFNKKTNYRVMKSRDKPL